MEFRPHSYQSFAIDHIIEHDASGLFLGLGLGKTVTTLTAINDLMFDYYSIRKVLVIAPKKVAESTWLAESCKWSHLKHLRLSRVLGTEKQRIQALNTKADIYVLNRENTHWIVEYYKKKWPFDMIVIDELSSFKSSSSQRFKSLRKVRGLSDKIVGLTGTPTPNGLLDLWPQVYLLDGGERLGKTMSAYRDSYFKPGRQDRSRHIVFEWVPLPWAESQIYEKLSDLCISMTAADWLDMPERIDHTVEVELSQESMAKYKKLERDMILELMDQEIVADTAAAVTGKLQQLAQGAIYTDGKAWESVHDDKLDMLEELIEEANGKPVLVFYWFKHDAERIKARVKQAKTLDTAEDVTKWNEKRLPVLLAHPASAGHGLNLQAGGNIIVWFGLTWSLELYQQANGRLDRQGQTESVIVHHMVAKGTVDEDIMVALENKAVGQDALMEAVKARIEQYKH